MKTFLLIAICMLFLQSCSYRELSIDDVIRKVGQADFSKLKGTLIYWRNGSYLVNALERNCAPYVVTVDRSNNSIIKINDDLLSLDNECSGSYFSNKEIKALMSEFLKYDFCVLKVDKHGNVFINPHRSEPPIYARKSSYAEPGDFRNFTPYKGNWYVRK